jgi:uncharacterized protein
MSSTCYAMIKFHQYSGGIIFFHIVVENKIGRHLLSEKLIEHALNYANENNLKIIPLCPYMKNYFHWHKDTYRCVGRIFVCEK